MEKYVYSDFETFQSQKQGVLIDNVIVETDMAAICIRYIVDFFAGAVLLMTLCVVLFLTNPMITAFVSVLIIEVT